MLETIKSKLMDLKMREASESLESYITRFKTKEEFILALLDSEIKSRQTSAIKRRISKAKFPFDRDWSQIDFKLNPKIRFKEIQPLSNGKFLERNENLCFLGSTGLGKTHSLISLGQDLCRKGFSVEFYTACDLVTLLEEAKEKSTLSKLMIRLQKPKLLIIDELGFVPFSDSSARLIFDVFSKRYERGSIAVSTNLSFEKWTEVFGSIELTQALVDRFSHRSKIFFFEGDSVRLLAAKAKLTSSKK